MNTPTLLIGLGGVGSRIVDALYGQLPSEDLDRVELHAIDTNVNDIAGLTHLARDNITQISERQSVGNYLYSLSRGSSRTTVEQWWPRNIPDHLTMTDGAGQTRAIARLAYHATLRRDGAFRNLRRQLERMFTVDGGQQISSVRVIIVCTLAGGTGAGTFLQTARYLRELIRQTRANATVLVRGMFILPSVAERFNTKRLEVERMSANAYACLKELNAMLISDPNARPNIQLEYRPDQEMDAAGRLNLTVPASPPIYDFCFVMDGNNTEGDVLPNWRQYEKQAIRTLYMQLFSPVAAANFSQEDNVISALIGERNMARFCSAGTATLAYPYADVLDYFSLRWARTAFGDDWLVLDEAYRDAWRLWQEEGGYGKAPQRPAIVCQRLKHEAEQAIPRPFFKSLWLSLHRLDELGRPRTEKVRAYLDAVDDHIDHIVASWPSLTEAFARFQVPLDLAELTDDQIEDMVVAGEAALERIRFTVDEAVEELFMPLVNDVVLAGGREPEYRAPQPDHSLVGWLLGGEDPMHPLAVRHFCYRLEEILDHRLQEEALYQALEGERPLAISRRRAGGLRDEVERLDRAIKRYTDAYDKPETDEHETATLRLYDASQQSLVSRLLRGNRMKEFADEYQRKASAQHQSLKQAAQARTRLRVYEELAGFARALSHRWELLFDALRDQLPRLQQQLERLERQHDDDLDRTHAYVLASRQAKHNRWEQLLLANQYMGGAALQGAVYRQFAAGCESYRAARMGLGGGAASSPENPAAELIESVSGWCRQALEQGGQLRLNLAQALREEARSQTDDPEQAIKQRVRELDGLSKPWVAHQADHRDLSHYDLWGLAPEVREALGDRALGEIFGQDNVVVSPGFSPFEIVRYQSVYGLTAERLRNFCAETGQQRAGICYERYHRWIRDIGSALSPRVTPHLDRNWHLPAYLPDFNAARVKLDARRIRQAFLFGLLYGQLEVVNDRGDQLWQFKSGRVIELLQENGAPVPGELHRLFHALHCNPVQVDQILVESRTRQDFDVNRHRDIHATHFYQSVEQVRAWQGLNLLDVILALPLAPGARERASTWVPELVEVMLEEIGAFFLLFQRRSAAGGGLESLPRDAAQALSELVSRLFEHSGEYNRLAETDLLRSTLAHLRDRFLQRIGVERTAV